MRLDIEVFEILESIRRSEGISIAAWAKASGMQRPRIHETRTYVQQRRQGVDNPRTGAVWTYDKFFQLAAGLRKIMGKAKFLAEINQKISEATDVDSILHLRILAMDDEEKRRLLQMINAAFPASGDGS